MGWSAGGKGCPTTNSAERAMLEGYRAGIQASLKKSKGGGKGGGGKGAGKKDYDGTTGGGAAAKVDRTCQRQGCHAAEKKKTTFGGGSSCFCCGLSLVATVPVQQLVGWAWEIRLKAEAEKTQGKTNGAAATQKPAMAAAGSAPKAVPSPEELLALRSERLALLKDAAATGKVAPKIAKVGDLQAAEERSGTATEEVARVFVDGARPPRKLDIKWAEFAEATEVSSTVDAMMEALKAESLPSDDPLKTPAEVVEQLVAKSIHSKTDVGKSQADAALQTTRECLKAMKAGGTEEKDELYILMVAREKQQVKEAKKLADKQPSKKSRQLHLESMSTDYAKVLGAQADGRASGAAKAKERAEARIKAVDQLITAATKLKTLVIAAHGQLSGAHQQRASQKEAQGVAVLQLVKAKVTEIEEEEEPDVLFEDAVDEPPSTSTEDERDVAQRLATLLQLQLLNLQTATTRANATIAEQAAALAQAPAIDPMEDPSTDDLNLEFQAEMSQLPELAGQASDEQKVTLAKLAAVFMAVPWGSPLPATTFDLLTVPPCFVHGMVGTGIWTACWGDRQANITGAHSVPRKLLNVLKWQVEASLPAGTEPDLPRGQEIYKNIVKEYVMARQAKEHGAQY